MDKNLNWRHLFYFYFYYSSFEVLSPSINSTVQCYRNGLNCYYSFLIFSSSLAPLMCWCCYSTPFSDPRWMWLISWNHWIQCVALAGYLFSLAHVASICCHFSVHGDKNTILELLDIVGHASSSFEEARRIIEAGEGEVLFQIFCTAEPKQPLPALSETERRVILYYYLGGCNHFETSSFFPWDKSNLTELKNVSTIKCVLLPTTDVDAIVGSAYTWKISLKACGCAYYL